MTKKNGSTTLDIREDLVLALLSVNSWTLEKVFEIRDGLQREGLINLEEISSISIERIAKKLNSAGYYRGNFICSLLANRLYNLSEAWNSGLKTKLNIELKAKRYSEVESLLISINGIGPTVVENFKILFGFPDYLAKANSDE